MTIFFSIAPDGGVKNTFSLIHPPNKTIKRYFAFTIYFLVLWNRFILHNKDNWAKLSLLLKPISHYRQKSILSLQLKSKTKTKDKKQTNKIFTQ